MGAVGARRDTSGNGIERRREPGFLAVEAPRWENDDERPRDDDLGLKVVSLDLAGAAGLNGGICWGMYD